MNELTTAFPGSESSARTLARWISNALLAAMRRTSPWQSGFKSTLLEQCPTLSLAMRTDFIFDAQEQARSAGQPETNDALIPLDSQYVSMGYNGCPAEADIAPSVGSMDYISDNALVKPINGFYTVAFIHFRAPRPRSRWRWQRSKGCLGSTTTDCGNPSTKSPCRS